MASPSDGIPPIDAEIALMQGVREATARSAHGDREEDLSDATLAEHFASYRNAAHPLSISDGRRRQDIAAIAQDERLSTQAAMLDHRLRVETERLDSDRVMLASMSRLDLRVRDLEKRGARSEQRVSDLSKCAQALTDEQRNMLLKLDALEAQTKVSFKKHEPAATDECLRRLSFLETEQQNFAVSLRKVLQTTEERLRRSEESANSRFLEVERALRKTRRSDVDASEHLVEDGRQRSDGETPGEQTADLGLRLEQCRESVCELQRQLNDLERNLEPRTDAVEARVMALADVTEELSAKLQRTTRCSEDAVTKTWSPGEDVARRVGASEATIKHLRSQLDIRPTTEQVIEAIRCVDVVKRMDASEEAISELWRRERSSRENSECDVSWQSHVAELLVKFDELSGTCTEHTNRCAERCDVCECAIEKLRSNLKQSVDAVAVHPRTDESLKELQAQSAELHFLLDDMVRRVNTIGSTVDELGATTGGHTESISCVGQKIEALRGRVEAVTAHRPETDASAEMPRSRRSFGHQVGESGGTSPNRRRATSRGSPRPQESPSRRGGPAEDTDSRREFTKVDPAIITDLERRLQALSSHVREMQGASDADERVRAEVLSYQLQNDVSALSAKLHSLQELVDGRVMTSVWRTERDVPSLLERVEQVMQECTERFEKVEEHEVKLGLSLSRLATVDQRLQSCMDRIERLPATTQVRMMLREDLHRQLEEINVDGLTRQIDLQARAIEEVADRVQVCMRRSR